MSGRWLHLSRSALPLASAALLTAAIVTLAGQPASLTVLSRDAKRTIPLNTVNGQDMVALDDLGALFQLAIRDDRGTLTVSYKGRTIILTPDQAIASVQGRLISLPAAPARVGGRWLVPIDFVNRALLPILDTRLELRRASRLLLVGDVRVPRVVVRQEAVGNAVRVTFETQPRADATVTPDGNARLTVKFDADAVEALLPAGASPALVQGFRIVEPTSVVIDLGGGFRTFRSATDVVEQRARLTIELLPAQPDLPATTPTPVEPPAAADRPAPVFGNQGIRTLAIDPGHGGDDTGAKSADGVLEKDVTLGVARRLRAAVEGRLGMRVLLTRDDDRAVTVSDRTALANTNKADILISLHANASFRPAVSGASVVVASFADDAGSLKAPVRLLAVGGSARDIELVPWNLAQIRHRDRSEGLARIMATEFDGRIPLAPSPVEHAPLRVLESANMPAVLVEMGYLTNDQQSAQLASADFQNAVAQSLANAVARMRDGSGFSEGAGR